MKPSRFAAAAQPLRPTATVFVPGGAFRDSGLSAEAGVEGERVAVEVAGTTEVDEEKEEEEAGDRAAAKAAYFDVFKGPEEELVGEASPPA